MHTTAFPLIFSVAVLHLSWFFLSFLKHMKLTEQINNPSKRAKSCLCVQTNDPVQMKVFLLPWRSRLQHPGQQPGPWGRQTDTGSGSESTSSQRDVWFPQSLSSGGDLDVISSKLSWQDFKDLTGPHGRDASVSSKQLRVDQIVKTIQTEPCSFSSLSLTPSGRSKHFHSLPARLGLLLPSSPHQPHTSLFWVHQHFHTEVRAHTQTAFVLFSYFLIYQNCIFLLQSHLILVAIKSPVNAQWHILCVIFSSSSYFVP